MPKTFTTPFKTELSLSRYPERRNELLQAWDSADELILEHLAGLELGGKRVVVLNDSFGALSVALKSAYPDSDLTTYTDSYVSAQAIRLNSTGQIEPISRLDELSGRYDFAVVRIPKNTSFLEDQLCHLSRHLSTESRLICGYMIKHQSKASFDLLGRLIGETATSLAKKKARLIFASFERAETPSPYPLQVRLEGFEKPFTNHSNLFSREKLDIGTRFLLSHIPQGDYRAILDLGCANGVIGIAAKRSNPGARIVFSDDSRMAIESAHLNFATYFPGEAAEFHWTNCFENQPEGSLDLVLCNPPFHQGNTLGDHIARQMFIDSRHTLRPGGRLRVIGNSHLRYPQLLRQLFGNSRVVATNAKFVIVDAERSGPPFG